MFCEILKKYRIINTTATTKDLSPYLAMNAGDSNKINWQAMWISMNFLHSNWCRLTIVMFDNFVGISAIVGLQLAKTAGLKRYQRPYLW